MADNYASNYSGSKGKAVIIPQGQTASAYGQDPAEKTVTPGAKPLKP